MTVHGAGRPDLASVLGRLKDFQRDSVDYIFRRLYLDQDSTRRFLLADEVGLGKTMVAKGVIAKAIDHLWIDVPRIDILYICSNSDIARQNLNRIKVGDDADTVLASRITLLPTTIKDLKKRKLNFISFTPGTSFDLRSSLGIVEERVLLYWLLRQAWNPEGKGALNVLQGYASTEYFRNSAKVFRTHSIDEALAAEFAAALEARVVADRELGSMDLRARFDDLCDRFSRTRKRIPSIDRDDRARLVGDFRALLAATCLNSLEPDLIVLDEFQRFKHLLDGTDPASNLARGLFECPQARVLLVSATPYKMYTLDHESGEDHYRDFLRTVKFLASKMENAPDFERLLDVYRREMFRLVASDTEPLRQAKKELENQLRRVMVRTERLAVSENRDGMLHHVPSEGLVIESEDLESYLAIQKVARALSQEDTLEYWKSSPYLLNFMENYQLKQAVAEACRDSERMEPLVDALQGSKALLPWQDVSSYRAIDPGNARLRSLVADTVGLGAWRLLWIPPSLSYYRLGASYEDARLKRLTKRLVFSSWQVVPKVIATLVSYEAERCMIRSFDDSAENSPDARKRRAALLRFGRTEGRLTGMPVLGLIYPCSCFAREFDPLALARMITAGDGLPTQAELLSEIQSRMERLLARLPDSSDDGGPADESWYWAAPLLLDMLVDAERTSKWLEQTGLDIIWSGQEGTRENSDDPTAWSDHVARARVLAAGPVNLGPRPSDLSVVLAQMAVAGPGVGALRAIGRIAGGAEAMRTPELRNAAAQVAWSFLHLFNLPETMALLRGMNSEEPYWRRVLEYCVDGGLQATLDEYAHVLRESLGVAGESSETIAREVSTAMSRAIGLRTASLSVDEISVDKVETRIAVKPKRMRAGFALRFGEDRTEDGSEVNRPDQVRQAFNSPFWPFVLATTSVGQEGLDFHLYCHAVVHWNLPSNPVDLEQREGRVHRYKGHAIRRNVAERYGKDALAGGCTEDPWSLMFDRAKGDRPPEATDLVPYWLFSVEGGARIERHVPALPLSRDTQRFDNLRRSLAVYRMVFGQPRQEDLLAYLLAYLPEAEVARVAEDLRIDLSPPR